jgi:hypothetical protein
MGRHLYARIDFNARIGDNQDFDDRIDCIPEKQSIDSVKNKFGDFLLDFLSDSNFCVLIGRGDIGNDNYTFVSTAGKSVVDYIAIPYSDLSKHTDFEVKLISDIISEFKIKPAAGATIPNHSVLTCKLLLSDYKEYSISTFENNEIKLNPSNEKRRLCNVKSIPNDAFSKERCKHALLNVIDLIQNFQKGIIEIDYVYKLFVDTLHKEMDEKIPYKDKQTRQSNKRMKQENHTGTVNSKNYSTRHMLLKMTF